MGNVIVPAGAVVESLALDSSEELRTEAPNPTLLHPPRIARRGLGWVDGEHEVTQQ